ncbi:MAG: hypothetical protein E7363_05440 [Clostridiales bacterium]|nr:hypothetical protein [Clostridiales bacterium]
MKKESPKGATVRNNEPEHGGKLTLILFIIVLSLVVGFSSFFAGYIVREKQLNKETRTVDWIITQIKQNYYEDFTSKEIIDAAALGLESLLDQYSAYYSEEEYQAVKHANQGYKLGIGVGMAISQDGKAVVDRVVMGSPADECGIVKGDILLGVRVIETPSSEFALGNSTQTFKTLLDQMPDNIPFELLTLRDGQERICTITKEEYVQITTRYYTQAEIEFLPEHAAYIRFDTFTGNAVSEFNTAMERFKQEGKTALILDLRGNGGGRVDYAQKIAAHLVKANQGETPLMMEARYQQRTEEFYVAESTYMEYGFTAIRVLCDENSASASEALLGAMLDYGSITLNDLYGTRTYGKGIMQTTFERFSKDDAIKLTTAKIHWPVSKTCIQGVGITPENIAPLTLHGLSYTFTRDHALHLAVESLIP